MPPTAAIFRDEDEEDDPFEAERSDFQQLTSPQQMMITMTEVMEATKEMMGKQSKYTSER